MLFQQCRLVDGWAGHLQLGMISDATPKWLILRLGRVIAMDSRDHGRSEDSPGTLTYAKMTDDLEPNIPANSLDAIQAPTLIIVGDTDLVRTEHAVEIFEHLPNGALAILPNATYFVPYDDPALFDDTVDRFLRSPFRKKDRIGDVVDSHTKLEAGLPR